jgi:hypothetical protein
MMKGLSYSIDIGLISNSRLERYKRYGIERKEDEKRKSDDTMTYYHARIQ